MVVQGDPPKGQASAIKLVKAM
jgi:hypothetical protein